MIEQTPQVKNAADHQDRCVQVKQEAAEEHKLIPAISAAALLDIWDDAGLQAL